MKRRIVFGISLASVLSFSFAIALINNQNNKAQDVKGYSASSLPTTIDLNDTSASDIRNYYKNLNNLSTSERQGQNLLKNLKTILKTGQKYYSYENGTAIWQMYEITDRDWEKSPASSTTYGTYNSSTNKITNYTYGTSASSSKNNPYIHAYYVNRNVENQVTAWDDHNQDMWGINREHLWPKAEGFDSAGAGGARGDPFHLVAANGYANNIHSNYYYGYVKTSSSYTNCGSKYSNLSGNLRGTSKTLNTGTVFEPQDSDKGDIARSIFYMVARYNFLSGSDSDGIDTNNPNLTLTQSISDWSSSGYTSSTSQTGKLGVLTDLLAWHHADPVDEYEIHRNNLLYKNFTNNRNPFIDFPEWADYIWGTATYNGTTYVSYDYTPTGYATPSSDTINGYNPVGDVSVTGVSLNVNSKTISNGLTYQLTATVAPATATNKNVTWSSSNISVATVSSTGLVTAKSVGNATITVRTADGGYKATCAITVQSGAIAVTSVSLDESELSLNIGDSAILTATIEPDTATNKNVTWLSSNTSVATVSNGTITAVAAGNATITVTTDSESKTASCAVTVAAGAEQTSEGSATAASGAFSGWTASGTGSAYADGSVKFDNSGDNIYKLNIFSGDVSTYMTNLKVTINGKINGTPTSANSYKVEAVSGSSIDNLIVNNSIVKTGADIYTSDDYSDVLFEISSNLTNTTGLRVTYATKGAGNWGVKSISWVATYIVPSGDVSVTGVSLDKSTLTLIAGENEILSATVSPSDAANTDVEWESSDYDVVDVDSSGNVTALSAGTATITVTTDDGGFTDTCEIIVKEPTIIKNSPFINGIPYKMYFVNGSTNEYFTGNTKSTHYGEVSTKKSDGVDVYFEQNGNDQNLYMIKDGAVKYFSITTGSYTNFVFNLESAPTTTWKYNSSKDTMTFSISNTEYTNYYSATYNNIGANKLTNVTSYMKFETSDGNGSSYFARAINNCINCNNAGTSAPSLGGFLWSDFAKVYSNLSDADKSALTGATASESGTIIQQFVARYDYIVGKYGYTDFLGRNPSPIGNHRISNLINSSNAGNYAVIIIVGLLTITSLAAFMIIRKKKEN